MSVVDILLPTANPDVDLVRRSIESVLKQEHVDWRLLVGSDGNNTDAGKIVQEFQDPRIQYFEFPSRGKPTTLNDLLTRSSAPYIAYLDDDDLWYPNHLKVVAEYLQEHSARFVHTDAFSVDVVESAGGFRERERRLLNMGPLSNHLLYSISHINVVHERSLLDEVGPYDVARPYFIDWDMFIRMAQIATPHHLPIVTCEHFSYYDMDGNLLDLISRGHRKNPLRGAEAKKANFVKARSLLNDEKYLDLLRDLEEKSARIYAMEGVLHDRERSNQSLQRQLEEIRRTLSWRVTKPLRLIRALTKKA